MDAEIKEKTLAPEEEITDEGIVELEKKEGSVLLYRAMASENARLANELENLQRLYAEVQQERINANHAFDELLARHDKLWNEGVQKDQEIARLSQYRIEMGDDKVITVNNPILHKALSKIRDLNKENDSLRKTIEFLKGKAKEDPQNIALRQTIKSQKGDMDKATKERDGYRHLTHMLFEAMQQIRTNFASGKLTVEKMHFIEENFVYPIANYSALNKLDL